MVETIEMPNVTGITLQEAKKTLKELGIEFDIQGELAEESAITKQIPSKGIQINSNSKVILYGE